MSPDVALRFAEGAGRLSTLCGASPLLGRLWGVLFLSPGPLSLDDLRDALGVAKSTVSVAARRLEAAGLVERRAVPADRRDYYVVVPDVERVVGEWARQVLLPELAAWAQVERGAEAGIVAADVAPEARAELLDRVAGLRALADRLEAFAAGLDG